MSNEFTDKKGLTMRDLIITGVLAALYFVAAYIGEMIFGFFPVLTFLCPLSIALLCGPVYMLILAKVPKHGPIVITGALLGLLLFVLGMYWGMSVGYIITGIAAELIAGSGQFKSIKRNIVSYMVFVLAPFGSYGALWFNRANYVSYLTNAGTPQEYMNTMISHAYWWVLPGILIGSLICSFLSANLGKKLLKKQFEKSGILE